MPRLVKNSLVKISSVYSQTLSRRATICPSRRGLSWRRVAQAVADLAFFTCFSLKRNWRDRLDVSMWSGSVTKISPLAPILIIAKFFKSSQPIAPAPITKVFSWAILSAPWRPTTIFRLRKSSPTGMWFFCSSSSVSGDFWSISLKWKVKNWRIGIYLLVMALMASWATTPPRYAPKEGSSASLVKANSFPNSFSFYSSSSDLLNLATSTKISVNLVASFMFQFLGKVVYDFLNWAKAW